MDTFKIASTGVSMNYMPHYIAKERRFFAELNMSIETIVPQPWTDAVKAIDEGTAHVVEGGMWVPMIYHNRVNEYKTFCQLSSRCPLVLVSREKVKHFDWRYLEEKTLLIIGGDGASHGLFIQGCAIEAGVDMSKVKVINNFMASMLLELFLGGFGDVIALQPDVALRLEKEGKGHILADMAKVGGDCPWSVYYSTPKILKENLDLAGRFTKAIQKGTTELLEKDASEFSDIIEKYWPQTDKQYAVDMINMFRENGMWQPVVKVDRTITDRWQKFLVYGNLLEKPIEDSYIIDDAPYKYTKK